MLNEETKCKNNNTSFPEVCSKPFTLYKFFLRASKLFTVDLTGI
jgi:hypothetical protein